MSTLPLFPALFLTLMRNMGIFAKMTITHLGMTIDYSSPGKVIFSMIDYTGKMIDNIPEYMSSESATPAAHHLFDIAEDTTKLSQADADLFHHFVAQLLYLSKRVRTDIQLAIPLICTRVRGPDTGDYKNLARVMK